MLGIGSDGRVPWPPAEEADRLRRYAQGESLYRGDHESVFEGPGWNFVRSEDASGNRREYLSVNLLGTLTDLLSWRLMGEGVEIAGPEDAPGTEEFFAALYHGSRLDLVHMTAAEQGSYCGDTFLKVRYDADAGQVLVEAVPPETVFIDWDPMQGDRIQAVEIGQVLEDGERSCLWIERHEMREGESWITNTAWALHGDESHGYMYHPTDDRISLQQIPQTAMLPEEQPTGVDGLLVVHIPNKRIGREAWGVSDYEGLLSLQGEINHRLTQRAEVLDKFVDPLMYGPDISGTGGVAELLKNKYLMTEPGETGAPAGYLVWDANLTAVVEELKELIQQFATTAKVDMQSLLSGEGGPVSGRAILLSQMRTQATVQAKQKRWEPGIREVFSLASKLAALPTTRLSPKPSAAIVPLEVEQVNVVFNDGLPSDRVEDIEEQIALVDAGLQTKTGALQALFGLTAEEADAMAAAIADERSATAVTPPDLGAALTNLNAGTE